MIEAFILKKKKKKALLILSMKMWMDSLSNLNDLIKMMHVKTILNPMDHITECYTISEKPASKRWTAIDSDMMYNASCIIKHCN